MHVIVPRAQKQSLKQEVSARWDGCVGIEYTSTEASSEATSDTWLGECSMKPELNASLLLLFLLFTSSLLLLLMPCYFRLWCFTVEQYDK